MYVHSLVLWNKYYIYALFIVNILYLPLVTSFQ